MASLVNTNVHAAELSASLRDLLSPGISPESNCNGECVDLKAGLQSPEAIK